MLKSISLENYVHFKHKTVIDFETSKRVKQSKASSHQEATTCTSDESAKGKKKSHTKKEQAVDCTPLNIFVGANFCGKSAVLELIRRCMTDEISASVTNSFDEDSVAYVFCHFNLDPYVKVISGNIKEPVANKVVVYKILIYTIEKDTFLRSKSSITTPTFNGKVQENVNEAIRSIFEKGNSNITLLLDTVKTNHTEDLPAKISWKTIENKYLSSLPLRGIGMVQTTKSDKIGEKHKDCNYRTASERAEVLWKFLSEDKNGDIDEDLGNNIFDFITYPEKFHFEKEGEEIYVRHNGSKFSLLKTSEGIIEAKLTSLLLAHKDIQTLCLEDPDRGMHPQMIERLKKELYREAYKKTIIVVTHSPYFIDTISVPNTFVFFREKTSDSYVCSVRNVGKSDELSKVSDIDTMRTLLFATKVLLVEGPIDREVVQGIFTQYKHKMLEREANENKDFLREKNEGKEANKIDNFKKDITTFQVIPVGGCENMKKVKKFCGFIHLPCRCLWDLDKVVKYDSKTFFNLNINLPCDFNIQSILKTKTKKISKFLEIDSKSMNLDTHCNRTLSSFIAHEDSLKVAKLLESKNIFIWRYGAVEDAILSSQNRNVDICESLNCKTLTSKQLKEKLKKRLNEKQRKDFYSHLMKVDEIRRFIAFLEENKEYQSVGKNYCEPNKREGKRFQIFAFCTAFLILVFAIVIIYIF